MAAPDELIETMACRMAQLHIKRTTGQTQKWAKIERNQREIWRSIARTVAEDILAAGPDCATNREPIAKHAAEKYLLMTPGMHGANWHSINQSERSLWRLIVRLAIELAGAHPAKTLVTADN